MIQSGLLHRMDNSMKTKLNGAKLWKYIRKSKVYSQQIRYKIKPVDYYFNTAYYIAWFMTEMIGFVLQVWSRTHVVSVTDRLPSGAP